MRPSVVAIPILLVWASTAAASGGPSAAAALARRGNAALNAGKYDAALKAYRDAEVSLPESPRLKYNQAVVHYRLRDFVKARELFTESLSTRDLKLEAAAHFNLGNCAYSQALEKLKSYDEAIALAREAIGSYRQALELLRDDQDARANIETARLLIKDLQDKKKKEEEERKKKPQSQPSSQPQSQPSSQPKQQENKGEDDKGKEQEKDKQGQQDRKQQQQKQQQSMAKQQNAKQKMSREEADRLLQAVRDKERQRRRAQARRQATGRILIDKDW